MKKVRIGLLTGLLIGALSVSTAEADSKTYYQSAKEAQSYNLGLILDKFPILKNDNPCYGLITPGIPLFTEDDAANEKILTEFKSTLQNWVSDSIKQIEASNSCFPKPTTINWETEVNNAQSNFYTKLKSLIPSYCVEIPLTKPVFTGDSVKDGEIYNLWVKNIFDTWANEMTSINKSKCQPSPNPVSSTTLTNTMQIIVSQPDATGLSWVGFCFTNPSEIKGIIEFTFTNGVSGGTSYDSVVKPEACPSGVLIPEAESAFYLTPGQTYFYSLTAINDGKKYTASITYTAPPSNTVNPMIIKNTEICKIKLEEFNQQVHLLSTNFETWSSLWKSYSDLSKFMKLKNWDLQTTYEYFLQNIDFEISKSEQLANEYEINTSLKVICSESFVYDLWGGRVSNFRKLIDYSFPNLRDTITNTYYPGWKDLEEQNNSYDDPAVFYEQVDHYYMKYVTSQLDWLKSEGIQFNFSTSPPNKPTWTNSKDGSNAKLVNDFISAMGKWWSVAGKEIEDISLQLIFKNIQNWTKDLQFDAGEYVKRIALEKWGAGGTYKFINPIPQPSQILLSNPTKSLKDNFENEINDWVNLEIKNLRIENYTATNSGEMNSQIKVCLTATDKAKSYLGRFDSQITNLTYTWSDYNRLLEVLKSKNISLLMYRVQIDQEVQSPYLSDLYDVVAPLLTGVKANCGYKSETLKVWTETYQLMEKEISKLRDFLSIISNYYENYRFSEPKLIPQIGKVTQIVGGCRVEILNYDPTFRWYAKGDMAVDVNGIATIYNGSVDQYLSTEKPGYQIVNYIEGLFKCPGIPKLSNNVVDVQAPFVSLLSLSKSELYKGQSFLITLLISDNKELNRLSITLRDQIGQNFSCYDDVAWKARTKGDNNLGIYQIECWIRSVSYDGVWKLTGSATDLNFNSANFDLAQIKVRYGESPVTDNQSNTSKTENEESLLIRTVGTPQKVSVAIKENVKNEKEEALLLEVAQRVSNLPKTTRSSTLKNLASIKNQINVVIETPKVCKYQNGSIIRVAKGVCSKAIEILDSTGNQYVITQQVRFR
jgi:hypothetical protein